MKATELLKRQHRKVEAIFDELERARAESSGLLLELANDLAAHMAIEQDLFYPAVREIDAELVSESFEEHALAEIALKRLLKTAPDDQAFDARVAALSDLIHHHVDEEESELFPAVETALGAERLEQLGKKLEEAFDLAKRQGFEALVPPGVASTSSDVALEMIRKEERATGARDGGAASLRR
jgi:hemerythrin superfamily protein